MNSFPKEKKGAILGIVLILMLLFTIIGYGLLSLSGADAIEAVKYLQSSQAFWAAEAGLQLVKTVAQKEKVPFDIYPLDAWVNYDSVAHTGNITGAVGGSNYSVDIIDDPAWDNTLYAIKKYIIISTGTNNLGTRQVQVAAQIETFASYGYASDNEIDPNNGQPIYFTTGDVIDGLVYTNDYLSINGTPIFKDVVKSAQNSIRYNPLGGPHNPDFQQGVQLGVPPLDLGTILAEERSIAVVENKANEAGGVALAGNSAIIFKPNGTMDVNGVNQAMPVNGAVYVNGTATVSGTVKGKITVAAENEIHINNNLVYSYPVNPLDVYNIGFDPNNNPNFTDSLGLIAKNDVIITTPYYSNNDVNIHAAIMSVFGGFTVDGYDDNSKRPKGGHLNLYGGLTQYQRKPIGLVDYSGYLKNYKYNRRFLNEPPPYYPYSNYNISQWQENSISS